jgi:hypothetical protein
MPEWELHIAMGQQSIGVGNLRSIDWIAVVSDR